MRIEATALNVPAIEQSYVEVDFRSKTEVLCRLLDLHEVRYGLIFGFTKIQVDALTETLVARGYSADKLHGDMTQPMRERTMKRFRERKIELLVATDVAARGLDVDDLEIVFNYELPHDAEDYVHRIGRTGRAGKSGKAISLVSGREFGCDRSFASRKPYHSPGGSSSRGTRTKAQPPGNHFTIRFRQAVKPR